LEMAYTQYIQKVLNPDSRVACATKF
jgi:hypothetical protein